MWHWLSKLVKWFVDFDDVILGEHKFEPAISLRPEDGRLGVYRCVRCGYCIYREDIEDEHPLCVPRAHQWVPVKVFQWEHVALANKLPEPLQCVLCGAHASTHGDWERFGCPGSRREDDR
jgi:hypothetical protein